MKDDMFQPAGMGILRFVPDQEWVIVPSGEFWYAHRAGKFASVLGSQEETQAYVRATSILWEACYGT